MLALKVKILQKAACCMILFIWHSGKGKTLGTEQRSAVARSLGGEAADYKGTQKFFGETEMFWILHVVIVTWLCMFFKTHRMVH